MESIRIAIVTEVYVGSGAAERLASRLGEAAAKGARLAVLPELPLNAWFGAERRARDEDAEPPDGPRQRALADSARRAGIGVLGGAIVHDPANGVRHNTALLFDTRGRCVARYRKAHLPDEPGWWETAHYAPGDAPPEVVTALGWPLGIQVCSDVQRPDATRALAASGALAVLAPRATEPAGWERWKVVLRANALTACAYVVSTNRPPGPDGGVTFGGPSVVIAPDGRVVLETEAPIATVELEREEIEAARAAYPGYLAVRPDLYTRTWSRVAPGRASSDGSRPGTVRASEPFE